MQICLTSQITTLLFGLLFLASCSVSPKNTDILEYGFKGSVKSVKSTMYYEFEDENIKQVIDQSKISQIRTITFNKEGNIIKAVSTYPEYPEEIETTYFEFEDGRKSGFYKINENNDTIERAIYTWISDLEYKLSSNLLITGRNTKSWSKLTTDYRDLSGGYQFIDGDSILYSNSYTNIVSDNQLITETIYTDELTKENSVLKMTYSNFDEMKNPCRLQMADKKTGLVENLTIREFTYFQ